MGEGKKKLRRIWERDEGQCGIHIGGCGKPVRLNEANIGHMAPRGMREPGSYDGVVSRTRRREMGRAGSGGLPREWNIQPMHKECNQKMGAVYPPVPLIQHCKCCIYAYMVDEEDGWKRIVEPWMGHTLEGNPNRFHFLRLSSMVEAADPGQDQVTQVGETLSLGVQLKALRPDGMAYDPVLVVMSRTKSGKQQADGRVGQWLTMRQMQAHNAALSAVDLLNISRWATSLAGKVAAQKREAARKTEKVQERTKSWG